MAADQVEAGRPRSAPAEEFQAFAAVVREVISVAAERAESLDELRLHQKGRLDVLARVHAMLLRDSGQVDFETLVWDELTSGLSPSEGDRISVAGPPVALERRAAELMALLLHELSTNAFKFGALAEDEGRVDVIWDLKQDGAEFHLSWTERGAPAPCRLPTRCGFGRELIETILPRRLGARTRFTLSGADIRCEIELPHLRAVQPESMEMAAAA